MPLPTVDDCDRIATDLETAARWIRSTVPTVLNGRPAPAGVFDGERAEQPTRRSSDVSDPTGEAILSTVDRDLELNKKKQAIRYLLGLLHTNAGDFVELVNDTYKTVDHNKRQDDDVSICAEPHCDDPADDGRDGRCEACDRSRYRWAKRTGRPKSEAPPVPKVVIAARIAAREKRTMVHADSGEIVESTTVKRWTSQDA